ncbi:peptidase M23 [Microbacterium sp. SS28]|uniref:CIS tube protein n=1 Tax=Microbacterium sp. SS28 TaxID=2919948 RepID=UPI001FAA36B4|nr:peptidase M23 [Microbacterium sp. SS28]
MPLTQTSSDSAKLVHARLELFEPGPAPGKPGAGMGQIEFHFNPKELTVTKAAKWDSQNQKKSGSAPPASYTSPEPQKMTLEMFFDATQTSGGSVVKDVEDLFKTLVPTEASRQTKPSPPWVKFGWGPLSGFLGYVKSVSAKYTLFGSDGRPLRAVCTVALEELPSEQGKQNPTSGGLQPRRVHTMREGDSLAVLAYREYGNAALWRPLADVNGIDDPMRVRPGSTVFLPTAGELEDADARVVAKREVAGART